MRLQPQKSQCQIRMPSNCVLICEACATLPDAASTASKISDRVEAIIEKYSIAFGSAPIPVSVVVQHVKEFGDEIRGALAGIGGSDGH